MFFSWRPQPHARAVYRPPKRAWVIIETWYGYDMAHTHRIIVGDRGRLVLPSPVRSQLDLKPGTHMLLDTEPDGTLRLRPYRTIADSGRGLFVEDAGMVDELLAERREAAASED
jgi:AbrB family looped-hinge helix DNA binding protein